MPSAIAKSIQQIFAEGGRYLTPLLQGLDKLAQINLLLKKQLAPGVREHSRAINLKKGRLSLAVDSNAWKMHLTYEVPNLLAELRQQPGLHGLSGIDITVILPDTQPTNTTAQSIARPKKTTIISPKSLTLMHDIADDITHPELRAILQRFGKKHDFNE